MCKFLIICGCLLAVAQAGVIGGGLLATAPAALAVQPGAASLPLSAATVALPTISTSSSNIIRGIGNLGAISAYAKSVDTPFSSVRKADVRVNNPGIVTATAVPASVLTVANTALAGPVVTSALAPTLLAPGLTTALAGSGLTTGLSPLGLNGLALNGLGAVKVL
ncbi:pupal cuticle protein C1B-like isoform X1 [Colletes gigas]|uniref:pupal cuticle protein C1B-like isoform X1 n=1 Tax=Colletes gigas TaxID=935657 RepID=UPI001C9A4CBE|nr:pupal cuticle protein C1B-like isoform X1 [Colletes gigas]